MPSDSASERRTAFVLLTLMALFFGGTWVAGKVAVDAIPPFTLATVRFSIASLLLWLWARSKTGTGRRPTAGDLPLIVGMGFTAVAAYNALFLYGLKLAPASDGAIIVPGLAPIMTAAMAAIFLGERIGRWGIAGMTSALAGLILVMNPSGSHANGRLLGDFLFFLGAVCWGFYSVMGKVATARFRPVNATLYATATGTVLLFSFTLVERGWSALAVAPVSAWIGTLYLALFGTVLGFVFFYEGIKRIGAARATTFAFLVPIFGVVTSVIMLGEDLTGSTFTGGALVLFGLWLVQRQPTVPRQDARLLPAK